MALVDLDFNAIILSRLDPGETERVRQMPGAMKNNAGIYRVPATLEMGNRVMRALDNPVLDPSFTNWHQYWLRGWKRRMKKLEAPIPVVRFQPWPHQLHAYNYARKLQSAMLSICMGGGKTKITHDLISNQGDKHTLIVCPLRVVEVWPAEFAKHQTELTPPILALTDKSVARRVEDARNFLASHERGVIVTNYEGVWRDAFSEWSFDVEWSRIVLDEVHRVKSAGGKASNHLFRLGKQSVRRLGLSGTPMAEGPLDLYGIYRYLDCGIFGTNSTKFLDQYAVRNPFLVHQIVGIRNEEELMRKYRSIAFEVGEEVLDLPGSVDQTVYCDMPSSLVKPYKEMLKHNVTTIQGEDYIADNVLTKYLRLQQMSSGFISHTGGQPVRLHDSKLNLLGEILSEIRSPAVIFIRFRAELDAILQLNQRLGKRASVVAGGIDQIKEWQEGKTDNLIVQIQAGSEGTDMTRARYGIYYSLGQSLKDYLQSRKRLDRPGQKHLVRFIHLLMRNSKDLATMEALKLKQDVIAYLKGLEDAPL